MRHCVPNHQSDTGPGPTTHSDLDLEDTKYKGGLGEPWNETFQGPCLVHLFNPKRSKDLASERYSVLLLVMASNLLVMASTLLACPNATGGRKT